MNPTFRKSILTALCFGLVASAGYAAFNEKQVLSIPESKSMNPITVVEEKEICSDIIKAFNADKSIPSDRYGGKILSCKKMDWKGPNDLFVLAAAEITSSEAKEPAVTIFKNSVSKHSGLIRAIWVVDMDVLEYRSYVGMRVDGSSAEVRDIR